MAGKGGGCRSLPPAPPPRSCHSPVCSSRSAFSRFTLPLSFFLSFRFLFSNRVPGCSQGGAPASEQLANSGRDGSRCRLHLLVPGKLWSLLGEPAVWGAPNHPGISALPGDAGRNRGSRRSELEAATVPSGEIPALQRPPSPQPHRFSSLTGLLPLAPAAGLLGEAPPRKPERVKLGSRHPGGGATQDRPGQLPALLSPFTFLPPPPTWLPATFSLFSFLVAPFPLPPQGSEGLRAPRILLVLTQRLGQVVDKRGMAGRQELCRAGGDRKF